MSSPIVVIGAGPAGLTAAYELGRAGRGCLVIEREQQVGGLARTIWRDGYGFDIGGHRFYTKSERVEAIWRELLGDDLLTVRRLSRIYYDGRFLRYPLQPIMAMRQLGVRRSAAVAASYLRRKIQPVADDGSFESHMINHFGDALYATFFKDYTEKVWGVPCGEIRSDWAAQRIKGLSLGEAVRSAFAGGRSDARSLVDEFFYPRLGPGMMWEAMADAARQTGMALELSQEVAAIRHDGGRVTAVEYRSVVHREETRVIDEPEAVLSTMPLQTLLRRMTPVPPAEVLAAAEALRYRDFITVNLVLEGSNPFPDQWVYVHDPSVRVGRIQNFRNWSEGLVPPGGKTGIGMEYFCFEGDDLWMMGDAELCELAAAELDRVGLAEGCRVANGFVVRVKKAYPLYDQHYAANVQTIQGWLSGLENLITLGRNGLHRYNNQDHSMIMAMRAVEALLGGGRGELSEVTTNSGYLE